MSPRSGVSSPQYRREQARFSGAVGAGDADLVAAKDGEIDLLEQRLRTAPQREISRDSIETRACPSYEERRIGRSTVGAHKLP